ncbi:2OG-Fe(II) oxygenase [Trinickia acidisoli]|uniref:2OG-Fe(II) oxygenase n=1 Tax=Trinickia acidisoli TaxID=2767482 RepID=UPI001A8D6E56|nr:2OG-Fe(II) oxygenase [Trinickia acidisoli]
MTTLDAAWQEWLVLNTQRGCTAESMLDAMLTAGLDPAIARAAIAKQVASRTAAQPASPHLNAGGTDPQPAFEAISPVQRPLDRPAKQTVGSEAHAYRYDPTPVAPGNVIRAYDRDVEVLIRCERPQLILFGNVLSASECEQLIERSRHCLRRSTTVNVDDGGAEVIQNRTSEGIWFQRCEDAFITMLDRRIAALMNWPLENGEGLQIMRYGVGGEYRPHFDFFPPGQAGAAHHTAHGGQRIATLIVYLNDVPGGGTTVFPEAGIALTPKRGNAVYFRYMNGTGQLDALSLHAGAPVTGGEKWIMTKWMRERAYV